MGRTPASGISEGHAFEAQRGGHRRNAGRVEVGLDHRCRVEHLHDALGGGLTDHPLVEELSQLALRAEHLDAHHQHDEQGAELHRARAHPPRPEAERHRRTHRDPGIGDAPGQGIGGEDPHGGAEHLVRAIGEQTPALRSLPEGLEGGEPLHRVEELRRERGVGPLAPGAVAHVPAMEGARREQGHHREGEQDACARQIDEGHHREHHEGRQGGNEELRQVLAEPGLELLDPLHHREQDLAGALQAEVGGPQAHHLVEEALAQRELHARRGAMCDHRAPVLERAAQHHDSRHQRDGRAELREARAAVERSDQPAQQRETQYSDHRREDSGADHEGDAAPDSFGELPQALVKEHGAPLCPALPTITTFKRKHEPESAGGRPQRRVLERRPACASGARGGSSPTRTRRRRSSTRSTSGAAWRSPPSYEYPGRYTRWDIGFVDPPLALRGARPRLSRVRAERERPRP